MKPKGRPADPKRRAAMIAGAMRYHGKPCAKGHSGERYTSTGACVACLLGERETANFDSLWQ